MKRCEIGKATDCKWNCSGGEQCLHKDNRTKNGELGMCLIDSCPLRKEKMKRWKPKLGEGYWCILNNQIYLTYYCGCTTCKRWIKNCFRTRKEAERELKKVRGGK